MELITASLKQGIIPAILVIIYLLIVKFIDSKKESKQAKIGNQLADSVAKISNFIEHMSKNIIDKDKEKCKIGIEDAMFSSAARLISFVSDTIVHNHINDNKDNILSNITSIVNTEYYTIYSTLQLYSINGTKVASVMKNEWISEIEKDITDIIYAERLKDIDKINNFNHRINFRFQSYVTFIINKILK